MCLHLWDVKRVKEAFHKIIFNQWESRLTHQDRQSIARQRWFCFRTKYTQIGWVTSSHLIYIIPDYYIKPNHVWRHFRRIIIKYYCPLRSFLMGRRYYAKESGQSCICIRQFKHFPRKIFEMKLTLLLTKLSAYVTDWEVHIIFRKENMDNFSSNATISRTPKNADDLRFCTQNIWIQTTLKNCCSLCEFSPSLFS